jgi:c-di-GMP-binding flagellar brake protein YcgR
MPSAGADANKRGAFRLHLDEPIQVRILNGPPVPARLVDISATGCRFRSTVALPTQTRIAFAWKRHTKPPLELRGRIATHRRDDSKIAHDYGVIFDRINESERDAIIAELLELQRREAMKHVPAESSLAKRVEATSTQKRSSYRAPVEFPVAYAVTNRPGRKNGTAGDLSTGGMRLIADEAIAVEQIVDFWFTLPGAYLKVLETTREVVESSPFGQRRVKRSVTPKPFEQMYVRGKVVKVLGVVRAHTIHGIAFVDLDPFVREEIGRFIHAVQLYHLRMKREG